MELTLEQYIANPMARAALLNATGREAMRNEYIKKYNALMVREHGKIDYKIFKDDKKNRYFILFRIPSETVDKFYYDTVIEFYTNEDVEESGTNLFKYNCKFYSNDPSFVYTYAYVFRNNDLFIEELKPKMSRLALRKAAVEKNPYNQVGYVKSIYFAYLTMVNKNLNKVDHFIGSFTKFSASALSSMVTDADVKIASRESEGKKVAKKKAREKALAKEANKDTANVTHSKNSKNSLKVANTSKVKQTKAIKPTIKKTKNK